VISIEKTSEFSVNSEVFLFNKCIREKPEEDEDSSAKRPFPDRHTNYTRKRLLMQDPIGGQFAHKCQEKSNNYADNSRNLIASGLKYEIDGAKIEGRIAKESVY